MYSTGQVAAIFQSTPSTGRATPEIVYSKLREAKISIHALHGEGDEYQEQKSSTAQAISIHALHGEGDGAGIKSIATYPVISIHAIHGEGDRRMSMLMPQQ